ncbi:MAG TPA: hypothetical protein VM240_05075 [Verrucomicrobiae bacterium]|nr:hypothetical protein [Verrucomicrobiae bacterium]
MIRLIATTAALLASATSAAQSGGSITIGNGDVGTVQAPPSSAVEFHGGMAASPPIVVLDVTSMFNAATRPPLERGDLPSFGAVPEIVGVEDEGVRLPAERFDTVAR